MKNIFYFLIISSFSTLSLASRARLSSLQSQNHFADTENIFYFPSKVSETDPFLQIESGVTNATTLSDGVFASGLVTLNKDVNLAGSVGRQDQFVGRQRILFNSVTAQNFELSQNPIDFLWSYKNKGQIFSLGLFYSNHNDKLNQIGESTQIIQTGYRSGFLSFALNLPLVNDVTMAGQKKINFSDSVSASVLYEIESLILSGSIQYFTVVQKNSGTEVTAIDFQNFEFGFSDRTDLDKSHFFYRVDVLIQNIKYKTTHLKDHLNQVPLTMGIESEFNEWLVLRGSVKQTFLISQFETAPNSENNTQAALGAGFKFKNILLDSTFSGLIGSAQTGALNGNQFLSQVAITSWF